MPVKTNFCSNCTRGVITLCGQQLVVNEAGWLQHQTGVWVQVCGPPAVLLFKSDVCLMRAQFMAAYQPHKAAATGILCKYGHRGLPASWLSVFLLLCHDHAVGAGLVCQEPTCQHSHHRCYACGADHREHEGPVSAAKADGRGDAAHP